VLDVIRDRLLPRPTRPSTKHPASGEGNSPPSDGRIHPDSRFIFFLGVVLAVIIVIHQAADAHFDFGVFYYAAHMVFGGSGHALYDLSAQHAFQARFHRPPSQLFYYPPYALIPFLGVAKLPILWAFSLWTALSLILVLLCVKILSNQTGIAYGNWPMLLSIAFFPVALALAHGQLSLLVLAAYVLTYRLWQKGRLFLGGAVLALAALKFQLVIGFVLVLLLKRKWRELGGFATVSAALLALSLLITGIPSLIAYPGFVLHSEGGVGSEPGNMANWRGLLSLFRPLFGPDHIAWMILVLSILTVFYAAWAWRSLDRGFSAAVLATMLVSYHLNPQDLSLSLLPFFLAVKAGILPQSRIPLCAFSVLFAPIGLGAVGASYAWLAILLAAALVWIGRATPQPELFCAAEQQMTTTGETPTPEI
jgi:hypothetical protein